MISAVLPLFQLLDPVNPESDLFTRQLKEQGFSIVCLPLANAPCAHSDWEALLSDLMAPPSPKMMQQMVEELGILMPHLEETALEFFLQERELKEKSAINLGHQAAAEDVGYLCLFDYEIFQVQIPLACLHQTVQLISCLSTSIYSNR